MHSEVKIKKGDKIVLVLSDCHLSAGRFYEGQLNAFEDFHFDDDMADLFDHFSTGPYGQTDDGPVDVELFLAGDYLDFLNVPLQGEFDDVITEAMSVQKAKAIIEGHPKVMDAIRRFASKPGKKVTYLIGNHDADLFFPKVREEIIRAWDPEGQFPSQKVQIIYNQDRVRLGGGVEIHHGCQYEWGSVLEFEKPILNVRGKEILNIPWSSIYVLKIVNRLKTERDYLDKVKPIRLFLIFGLVIDPFFTIRFAFLTGYYFFKTRISNPGAGFRHLLKMLGIARSEASLNMDLETPARTLMNEDESLNTVIMGHNHQPQNKVYSDGKQYINTGTWTKMIHLDFARLGSQLQRTFALVHIKEDHARCELRQWVGEHGPHKVFNG